MHKILREMLRYGILMQIRITERASRPLFCFEDRLRDGHFDCCDLLDDSQAISYIFKI